MILDKLKLERFCDAASDPNLERALGIGIASPSPTPTPGM